MASIEEVGEWQEAAAKKVGLKAKDIDDFSLVKFRRKIALAKPIIPTDCSESEEIIFEEPIPVDPILDLRPVGRLFKRMVAALF